MIAKKKKLIELMLDVGIDPEDFIGNYVVSDTALGNALSFYDDVPKFNYSEETWGLKNHVKSIPVLSLAKNWKRTIITKQQFVDAYNEKYGLSEKTNNDDGESNEKTESFKEADKRADNYASLSNVLRRAYDQASSGKGQERHGQDLAFTKQPMQLIQDLCGEGFALGQAMKKMQESQRLPHDAAIRELLGAINYIAGAIIHKEKLQGSM